MLRMRLSGPQRRIFDNVIQESPLLESLHDLGRNGHGPTVGHTIRVMQYAILGASEYGAAEWYITEVARAAGVHDLGKRWVPPEILYLARTPTPEEATTIKDGHVIHLRRVRTHPRFHTPEFERIYERAFREAFPHHELLNPDNGYPRRGNINGNHQRTPLTPHELSVACWVAESDTMAGCLEGPEEGRAYKPRGLNLDEVEEIIYQFPNQDRTITTSLLTVLSR